MGIETGISWTDHTINFWFGCVKVSPGCEHCYAESQSKRYGADVWGTDAPRQIIKSAIPNVYKWKEQAKKDSVVRRVFCMSMGDIFERFPDCYPQKSELEALRTKLFEEIIPATPNLEWLLLTKRIGNVRGMVPKAWTTRHRDEDGNISGGSFPANVRLGISVVNQEEADRDIPKLLQLPSKNFLSCEPLLGAIDFTLNRYDPKNSRMTEVNQNALAGTQQHKAGDRFFDAELPRKIDWVIVGGESGSNARPMNPDWARSIRNQCQRAETPFHFKQWGEILPFEESVAPGEWYDQSGLRYKTEEMKIVDPKTGNLCDGWHENSRLSPHIKYKCVGKKKAGRLLDGEEWNMFPKEETA